MTLRCPRCDGEVHVVDTNGAAYPETLVETCECQCCDHQFTHTLTA